MTYADSTNLGYIIASIADSVSANLKSYAITVADNWVNAQVGVISGTTPALVKQAAEYFAAAFILRNLYDTDSEEAATAVWYEKMAHDMLEAYQAQNPGATEDYDSPYSSSMTPTEKYMDRNIRTEYDPDEFEEDNVINEWDSE